MSDAAVRGRFVWHELMTTDVKGAGAFYAKVTGWKTQTWDKDSSYTLFTSAGRPTAGLMLLGDEAKAMGAPPNWLAYIGTENVDETAREAVALGAKLLKPGTDIPGTGRFAVLQDPQNAVFAVFTPAPTSASDSAPVVEPFSWHELATTDAPAAVSFYRRLFGWEETDSMDMGADGKYQMFGLKKGSSFGGVFNRSKQMPGPPAWTSYIKVADSKKAADATTRSGGRVLNGPMEVPGGDLIVQGMDPQGAVFAVHSAKPSAASAKPAAAKEPARAKPAKAKAAATTRAKAKSAKKKAAKSPPAKRSAAAKTKRPVKKAKTAPKRNARGKKKAGSKKRRR